MVSKKYRVVFIGPQGSGKGTQAEMLSEHLGLPVISTGQIYRQEAAKKTLLGEQVASYMHQGKLVPDEITNALVEKRLNKKDCAKGFILDGYPRTMMQVLELEQLAAPTRVIDIELTDKQAIERVAGRVICSHCGAVYHYKHRPTKNGAICDRCGKLVGARRDDKEELTLRKRLSIYREQVEPIEKFYQSKGILNRVDGSPNIHLVHEGVMAYFPEVKRKPIKT